MGKYKGISYNNFIIEFENFIKNNSEMMKKIKEIIAKHIDKSEKIINILIKDKFIDLNTIDFVSTILNYIIDIFNKQLEIILSKSESNNFFVTDFMLHIENKEKSELNDNISNSQLTSYSFNISDEQLLKNNIFIEIRRKYLDYLHNLKEDKDGIINKSQFEIKIFYKIPGFFNIYREINQYMQDEKLLLRYSQNEREVRKSEFEFESKSIAKLNDDEKEFTNKLFTELISKEIVSEIIKSKNKDDYIQFTEAFLNDYITFYLVNIYKNVFNDFVINDTPHKIILILLDLKFRDLEDKNQDNNILLKNVISKIL